MSAASTRPIRSPRGTSARTRSRRRPTRLNEHRFDAIHFEGPGHRPDRRPAAELDLPRGTRRDRGRDRAPRQPADGGGLRDARPASGPTAGSGRRSRSSSATGRSSAASRSASRAAGRWQIDAEQGAGVMRGRAALDDGAARLGEVALVDREGRIGRLGTSLLRHAARRERGEPHRARRRLRPGALPRTTDERRNRSAIHIDFMIGARRGRGHRDHARREPRPGPPRRQPGRSERTEAPRLSLTLRRARTAVSAAAEDAAHEPRQRVPAGSRPAGTTRGRSSLGGRGGSRRGSTARSGRGRSPSTRAAFGITPYWGKPGVSAKPGRTVCTRIPRRRSWAAVARENASWACFDAP